MLAVAAVATAGRQAAREGDAANDQALRLQMAAGLQARQRPGPAVDPDPGQQYEADQPLALHFLVLIVVVPIPFKRTLAVVDVVG